MGRVDVLPLFNPDLFDPNSPGDTWPGTVTLMVVPASDPQRPEAPAPDRLFLDAVCKWLDPRRLLTTEIFVRGPEYVPVYVSAGIVSMPGQLREQVRRDVQDALRTYLSPLLGGAAMAGVDASTNTDPMCDTSTTTTTGATACPTPRGAGWPLGVEVRVQDLEAVITRVPGVRYVKAVKLGMAGAGGVTLTDVDNVPLSGLQLPRLATISVREGDPDDIGALLGLSGSAGAGSCLPGGSNEPGGDITETRVAVPVLPKSC